MSEETTQETPVVDTADAPEQKASEQETQQAEGLIPQEEEKPVEGNAPIPEGLDEELFDAETRTLKESAVVERLKKDTEDIARWKKQANDMRRKLSKGVDIPDKQEEYAEGYVPEEKYEYFLEEKESPVGKYLEEGMKAIEKTAYDTGMSKAQANAIKDLFLRNAENTQILDTRTEEEKEKARAEYLQEQKALLGEDAEQIIKQNVRFTKDYGLWSEDEKKWMLGQMDKSAVANSVINKVRKLFDGNTSEDIPVRGVSVSGLADDRTLATEYYDEKTSDARRMQILQQRIDAGRSGGLPMP